MDSQRGCRIKRTRSGVLPVSHSVEYGLFFLAVLSRERHPRSARIIAQEGGLSFSFLQKVAHLLKRAGLVGAARGKTGGYTLARLPHTITVRDVIEAVGGTAPRFSCGMNPRIRAACPRKNFCMLKNAVDRVHQDVVNTYFSKKLTDFIA